jgi:hypothetical protein
MREENSKKHWLSNKEQIERRWLAPCAAGFVFRATIIGFEHLKGRT